MQLMRNQVTFFRASEAAERLGVTTKALRLYEQRNLVTPACERGLKSA